MIKKVSNILCVLLLISLIFSNTRVSFSRPGSVIRTPGRSPYIAPYTTIVGFSAELLNTQEVNYAPAIYGHILNVDGYNFGISYFSHAASDISEINSSKPASLNISVDKQVFYKDNMTVSVGVHDILYDAPANHRLSIFANFSHYYKINNGYDVESTIGFGSGYLSEDSHDYNSSNKKSPANFFASIKINTPILNNKGKGIQILAEYDGWGLNFGVSVPIEKGWKINTGITHFENIYKFEDWDTDGTIFPDAPAILFGFEMQLPQINYDGIKQPDIDWNKSYSFANKNQEVDSLIAHANNIIENLEDSLMLQKEEQKTLDNLNQALQQKTIMLADSLYGMHLNGKIFQNNLNKAMKQLSKSLDAYYLEDYITALSEVDKALEIYPDLAISYARKGSVYYKMGETKRATINWNIALKLDPEYVEVRNILIAIKDRAVDLQQLPE